MQTATTQGATSMTTITAETYYRAANQARLDRGAYDGSDGIRYNATGEHAYELRGEFGTATLLASAQRAAFDAVKAAGYFPSADGLHGIVDFDIEVIEFDGRYITARFERR